MQNPGRGRRNAAIGFALALVALCGFGTTSAQASDELTIASPDTNLRIGGIVGQSGGRAIQPGIRYGASGPHLTPGSQVRLRPAPTAELPSADDVVITVPTGWGPGHGALRVGDVTDKGPGPGALGGGGWKDKAAGQPGPAAAPAPLRPGGHQLREPGLPARRYQHQ